MNTDHRPVYIDLRKINLPVSALISITHRLSGMYVFFITLPLMLALIFFSTESEDSFNNLSLFLKDYKFILGLIVLSFCILWYHILSGVRHLIMDAHIGESLIASKYSAIFTISLWIITTSFVFWRIFS
ncbi:succinate dehydrogenase, cytochrome b556 subunit [Pseudomonadota bacterium]|nr:succinate dehydrogenase, cytochrome b556 subunit [Pseudomonadota bacterium]